MTSQNDKPSQFLLKEFSSLRVEMGETVKETRALERWALATVAAIWSWLATHSSLTEPQFWWVPALIVSFFYFRTVMLMSHIDELARYLKEMEKHFQLTEPCGFEHRFASSRGGKFKRATAHAFWVLLLVVSIVGPFALGT